MNQKTKTTKKTLNVLEWDKILDYLASHATSTTGKERCLNIELFSDINRIKDELNFTTEAKKLLDKALIPPFGGIRNVKEPVSASKVTQLLGNSELIDIARTIQASRLLKSFFNINQEDAPSLFGISIMLFENKELEKDILNTFDEAGEVTDAASPELKRLRSSLRDQTKNLKDKLGSTINSLSKYLQEPVFTQRDDRYVVPVKIEQKAHVQGIVHDVSSSGATVFIEPKAIVELNNALKETELKIDNEIRKILSELTKKVSEFADEILPTLKTLAEIDFIFAKAKYSIELKAVEPDLNKEKIISLKSIKHPVLMKVIENVIPNDIILGQDFNSLIITGSNTGGKTVALKAIGLAVLMTKAGLHIPAHEGSIYPFNNIFADIGDEQSVIQSLSTFSGHMTNIINIVNNVDDESLVILDEVGAGTDPSEGSALAQAILESLYNRGARTIVTTHYGELKALAYTKEGFENASVQFDTETLQPTYKLLIGIPGKSNAITISQNLGLAQDIINQAQEIYITQKDTTGEVLEGLQTKQQELTKNTEAVKSTKEELQRLEQDYNEKLDKIRTEKKKTIDVFKKKYETEIAKARQEIKDILREVRESKSEKLARRAFNKVSQIESGAREGFYGDEESIQPEYQDIDWEKVEIGDSVFVKDLRQVAELLTMPDKNKKVEIQVGMLKTKVKINKLAKTDKKAFDASEANSGRKSKKGFKFGRTNISNTLDLRGARVEEGLDKLEKYLDDASLANLHYVTIIHGHGTGALKQAVREYLDDSPYVAKSRPGESEEGGDGVSIVDIV